MAERKQIAVWVNGETASLIESLRKETGCTTGKLIELAIAVYATSERTSIGTSEHTRTYTSLGTSTDTSESLVQLLEWRDEVNTRLRALEGRVEGIGAVGKGMDAPADKMAVAADAGEISLQIGFSTLVENQPKETHLRPLKAVPEAERKAIWEEATRKAEEEHAKLTAKRVDDAVAGAETVEPVAVETVEAGAVKKQTLTDDELDVLVRKYLAEANGVAAQAIKAMQRDGCSCQRNRFFASKKRLKKG